MGTHLNRHSEAVLTRTHNLCFRAKNNKIMYSPVNPIFSIYIYVGMMIYVTKAKVTRQLICAFVFLYAISRFSHDVAEIEVSVLL